MRGDMLETRSLIKEKPVCLSNRNVFMCVRVCARVYTCMYNNCFVQPKMFFFQFSFLWEKLTKVHFCLTPKDFLVWFSAQIENLKMSY